MQEIRKFSIFTKQSEVIARLPREDGDKLAVALFRYGAFGEVPEFENVYLEALFYAMKEDTDNSVRASNNNAGGRPDKEEKTGGFEDTKTGGFENQITPPTDNPKTGGFESSETPSYINQTNNKIKPNKEKEKNKKEKESPPRQKFKKPTLDELNAYKTEQGYSVDVHRFFDFYESNGWRVGKNAMKDWRAAMRSWQGREKPASASEVSQYDDLW